jgi:hypothetical protein
VDLLDGLGYDCYWAMNEDKGLWRITGCWDPRYSKPQVNSLVQSSSGLIYFCEFLHACALLAQGDMLYFIQFWTNIACVRRDDELWHAALESHNHAFDEEK